jgi:hypothetical protein
LLVRFRQSRLIANFPSTDYISVTVSDERGAFFHQFFPRASAADQGNLVKLDREAVRTQLPGVNFNFDFELHGVSLK